MKLFKKKAFFRVILIILLSSVFGFLAGFLALNFYQIVPELKETIVIEKTIKEYEPQTTHEQRIINIVKQASPTVVSVVASKDIPKMETYLEPPLEEFFGPLPETEISEIEKGEEKEEREIGWATGFIVSEEGLILTNKHVVVDEEADYTIFTTNDQEFSARVVAKDPFYDIAILEIQQDKIVSEQGTTLKPFPTLELGDSEKLEPGQTVIAIGNALGELKNTVSVGVISGLGRNITASGGGIVEVLEDVIQTDAAINKGNSGGPLLNLKGEVIGVNTAMAWQAQNIGFALPINNIKKPISQVQELGKIVYAFLGVRYVLVDEQKQKEYNLPVDYGAWLKPNEVPAVEPDSAAYKSGLVEGDIVLEVEGEKVTKDNSLARIIRQYEPEDRVDLKILRGRQEKRVDVILGKRTNK